MSHSKDRPQNMFTKDGVIYTFYMEFGQVYITDIDIPEELETFTFCAINKKLTLYNLKKFKRDFPNIKTINIDDKVYAINIDNSLFPSLENVKSTNRWFSSGPHLIYEGNRLQNTFFHNEDSVVDMHGIEIIDSGAFTGCRAKKSVNDDTTIVSCSQDAFRGYEYLSDDGHVKSFGRIIVQSDKDGIIDVKKDTYICPEVHDVKKVIVHNENDLVKLSKQLYIETLVLDFDDIMPDKLCDFSSHLHLKNIIINNSGKVYKSVDGVVYSADGRVLFAFPRERSGHYDILPGTEIIAHNAFLNAAIESVSFPESLKHIMDYAFSYSNVKSPVFPEGLLTIGIEAFSHSFIENIVLPASVTYVGNSAFSASSLRSIRINSKVSNIMHTFCCTNDDDNQYVISLSYGDSRFFLPSCKCSSDILSSLELLLFAGSLTQACIVNHISDVDIKQEVAFQAYKENPDDEIRKYLRRTARNLVTKLTENNNGERLIEFLSMNIMTKEQLQFVLKKADGCSTSTKAYIMQAINSIEDKTSFRL